jgi:predicted metalloprotease with PDZ domain
MAQIVGEFPKDIKPYKYVFIVQNVASGGGGIEHLNSTVLVMPRFNYSNAARYQSFLSLVAHEYFHLWNVKRIRPIALGPFDYNTENYTKSLWIAEGITSYYDELALFRAGFIDRADFLRVLGSYVNGHENRPGSAHATLHEMSFDAWIKEYRPNENSKNSGYSYYSKGFVIAALLDAKICQASDGKKSLDDVFRKLWTDFYGAQKFGIIGNGFTDDEFIMVCNEVAGTRLNDWFRKWLETAERPDYADIIGGFKDITVTEATSELPGLHVQTKKENGALMVGFVHRNGTAARLGLNVNDELLSLNDYRITDDIDVLYAQLGSPKKLNILVSRGGKIISLKGEKTTVPQYQWDFSLRAKALGDPFWSHKGPLQTWLKPTL